MTDVDEPPNKELKLDGLDASDAINADDKDGSADVQHGTPEEHPSPACSGPGGATIGLAAGTEADSTASKPLNGLATQTSQHAATGEAMVQNGVVPIVEMPNGVFSQRELYMAKREAEGELAFKYVENDGSPDHNMWLIGLKNIFSKQLPNMPKEYIARLVLDRRHRSVAIIRHGGAVLGGITYRPFHQQGFGEIAFCAVTAMEQVKGFGARLMNFTKEYARAKDSLTHFLTYADNNAVGYFSKQGFTKEITLDKERWVGYIKDYDGGTLMECIINERLPYTDLPGMLRAQRAALDRHIRTLSLSHVVHPGLAAFAEGRQHVDIASIPGVGDAGWTADAEAPPSYSLLLDRQLVPATPYNLRRFMEMALNALMALDDSWPFRDPVDPEDVPDYYDVIKDPLDLSLIRKRLSSGTYYLTLNIFVADVNRMCANARIYNAAETIYYKLANKVEAFLEEYLHTYVIFDGR